MTPAERKAEILEFRKNGASYQQIGERFAISRQRASAIVNGRKLSEENRRHGRPCPICGGNSKLLWVRDEPDGTTRRRRECRVCKNRWNRVEKDVSIGVNP